MDHQIDFANNKSKQNYKSCISIYTCKEQAGQAFKAMQGRGCLNTTVIVWKLKSTNLMLSFNNFLLSNCSPSNSSLEIFKSNLTQQLYTTLNLSSQKIIHNKHCRLIFIFQNWN